LLLFLRKDEIMPEFKLEDREYIELSDLLKVTGLCDSGGMAKTMIAEGRITVDGRPELRRRCKIRAGQVVAFEGRTIAVS
jgi:ribosome-associated protein